MGVLGRASEVLLSPTLLLVDPVERGTARLLSACVLALTFVFVCLDSVLVMTRPGHLPPWQGYLLLGICYGLSRSRHYRFGALLCTAMFPAVGLSLAMVGGPHGLHGFSFALLAPFFAGMFLGLRGAVVFAVVTPLVIAALPVIAGVPFQQIVHTMAANVMGGLVAIAYALHRDWAARRRNEQTARQEAQLIHMQKMEAIGRMAGGIAHDFNNLLTVIGGVTELLARNSDQKEIRLIESATRSAQDLTEQLLTLSRQQISGEDSTELGIVLDDTRQLLSRIIGEDIELCLEDVGDVGAVALSKGQIQQILLNLATNARDAMPGGGTLTFRAEALEDHRVRLTVRDTGCGMDDEVQRRVFEPFFTTKDVGEGTGLGLSMVFGLVNQAGGDIAIESEQGKGTTFSIILPRAADRPSPVVPRRRERLSLGGTARGGILLVEDDASVRELCRSVLRKEGYDVVEAAEPKEALEQFRNSEHRIDLLITDVVMPGMSGPALAEILHEEAPDLPVVFISGYAPEEAVGRRLPAGSLLKKPFRPTQLLRRVSAMLFGLDSHAPPAASNDQGEIGAIPAAGLPPAEEVGGDFGRQPDDGLRSKSGRVSKKSTGDVAARIAAKKASSDE